MKHVNPMRAPDDADVRRGMPPVICYPTDALSNVNIKILDNIKENLH